MRDFSGHGTVAIRVCILDCWVRGKELLCFQDSLVNRELFINNGCKSLSRRIPKDKT